VAKFRCALPSNLRRSLGAVVSVCEANCDPQGFLLALSAFSSAEMARARTWSSIQEKFGVAVSCPLGTGGELLRYSFPEHLPIVRICCAMYILNSSLRFSSSKFDLTFYWRIHCDETGRVQQSARLMPNIVDTSLSKCDENALNFAPSSHMTPLLQEEHCHFNEAKRHVWKTCKHRWHRKRDQRHSQPMLILTKWFP
jgi:hypothetical protein